MSNENLPKRDQIAPQYRWNAASVYPNRAEWQAELAAILADTPALAAFAGTLPSGPSHLADFLERYDRLALRAQKLNFYAVMSQTVDTGDAEASAMVSQANAMVGTVYAAIAFREPEIIGLGSGLIGQWLKQESRLEPYRHFFDDLFRRQAHVRTAEVESVLGMVSEVFSGAEDIHHMLVNSDLKFQPIQQGSEQGLDLEQSNVENYLSNPEREIRRQAWENYCDSHNAFANTLSASLCTAARKDIFLARVRGFDNSLDAALFDSNIPKSVYENTIGTFRQKLPVWHRYWRVRRKALGLKQLHHWDIWAPIARTQPKIPYAQAVDWIASAMAPLGKDYTEAMKKGCLEQGWVDVYPSQGKSSGAFSYGVKGTYPFIMASYTDDLSSLSTLTHELGHSMHSLHTWRNQPDVSADYSIFVAEVASNFHQALTRAWLFDHQKDKDFQIALIEEAMENFHRYFFIMPTLARFELEVHQGLEAGKGLNSQDLNNLMADFYSEGYGGEMALDRQREGSTWAQFSHLYMNYYVFQYATGISAAHALAGPILAGDKAAAERYLQFLSSGSSLYPVDALKLAGVDMTTTAAMEAGFRVLEGLIDRLEELTS